MSLDKTIAAYAEKLRKEQPVRTALDVPTRDMHETRRRASALRDATSGPSDRADPDEEGDRLAFRERPPTHEQE